MLADSLRKRGAGQDLRDVRELIDLLLADVAYKLLTSPSWEDARHKQGQHKALSDLRKWITPEIG